MSAQDKVLRRALHTWRSVAGKRSPIEPLVRKYATAQRNRVRTQSDRDARQITGKNFVFLESRKDPEPRVGIYLRGGCDLPSMFATAPLVRERLRGTCCIYNDGIGITDARADILLQALQGVPEEHVTEVIEQLGLPREYFSARLLEPNFDLPDSPQLGTFPKSVVVLSAGPNLVRSAYRHKEHGYLVDPGGWWLNQSMADVLSDLSKARWFKANFESVGRITLPEFRTSFAEVVRRVQKATGGTILVYNALVVEPGRATHNFQFVRNPQTLRGRRLHLELVELSSELGFHLVDVDRVLKRVGVAGQVDFAHFLTEHSRPIAAEAYRILSELEIVS